MRVTGETKSTFSLPNLRRFGSFCFATDSLKRGAPLVMLFGSDALETREFSLFEFSS